MDIAGSFSPTSWFLGPHPRQPVAPFLSRAVENARAILDAVKPTRTTFCYELMAWSLPDSPDACLRLIAAVDRKAFSVHLDPCNLINSPERYYRSSEEIIRECYRKLGPRIASVHAKDLAWDVEMAVHFREVRIGLGNIDYGVFLAEHARLAPDVPLIKGASGARRACSARNTVVDVSETDPHLAKVHGHLHVPSQVLGVDARDAGAELPVALADDGSSGSSARAS